MRRSSEEGHQSLIKVLITTPNLNTAGSGKVIANLVRGLDEGRFQASLAVESDSGALYQELIDEGFEIHVLPFHASARPYMTLPARVLRLARPIRPQGFHLWHSFHYLDDYTEPLVARASGARAWIYTKKSMSWGSRGWLVRSLLATRIAVDNTTMPETMFNRAGLRRRIRLIPHGIVPQEFEAPSKPATVLRNRLNIGPDQLIIGCVANLVPIKGHSTLIEAFSALTNTHLVLAGRSIHDDYSRQLKQDCEHLGLLERVHFLGNVEDVSSFLGGLDIFALPTLLPGEGCPVALLEAMAASRACVASDVPGCRDVIENGISGLLVPPGSPQALASALQELAASSQDRVQLGKAAHARATSRYTVRKEVEAYEALYSEVVAEKAFFKHK